MTTPQTSVTPVEARAIAKEAYIYGFPMVDNYRIQYAYFVDRENPEFKASWNELRNIPRAYTPNDKAVQTPNSDTPYSLLGADLRAGPIVISVPTIEKNRYFSVQLIDAYTFNFAYIGSRTTGNDGGTFPISGPGWKGETPEPLYSTPSTVVSAWKNIERHLTRSPLLRSVDSSSQPVGSSRHLDDRRATAANDAAEIV
jgi:hypothetical protein